MDAQSKIREFLEIRLQEKSDTKPFSNSDSLVVSRRLDSFDVVEVVVFLEQEFGVDFSNGFDQELVDSVDAIMALVNKAK